MIAPIVSAVAEEYEGKVKVCKVVNMSVGLQSKSNICGLLGI